MVEGIPVRQHNTPTLSARTLLSLVRLGLCVNPHKERNSANIMDAWHQRLMPSPYEPSSLFWPLLQP